MNETVIEAQARYLIEDRIQPTHRAQPTGVLRRHRRLRRLGWTRPGEPGRVQP